jgi:hypothetical protein
VKEQYAEMKQGRIELQVFMFHFDIVLASVTVDQCSTTFFLPMARTTLIIAPEGTPQNLALRRRGTKDVGPICKPSGYSD